MKRAIVFGPARFGGADFHHHYVEQGINKTRQLIGQIRQQSQTGDMMMVNLETLQLLAGIEKHILVDTRDLPCLPDGWATSLREFLNFANATIDITDAWVPSLQRVDDEHLMEKLTQCMWKKADMMKFQMCGLCLQACSLADIVTLEGKNIEGWAMNGELPEDRQSPWLWPHMERPPEKFWTTWRRMLRKMFSHPCTNDLHRPLGKWITDPHQKWKHHFHPSSDKLIEHINQNSYIEYEPTTLRSRQQRTFYTIGENKNERPPTQLTPASASNVRENRINVTVVPMIEDTTITNNPTTFREHVARQPNHIRRLMANSGTNNDADDLASNL